MAPHAAAQAAAFQRSRSLKSSIGGANQSLVRSGAMQLQPSNRSSSSSSSFPAWHQPVAVILSPQLSSSQLPENPWSSYKITPARSHSPEEDLGPESLRDRVASTKLMSETLRDECLERLDKISLPKEICRRQSWTHLHDIPAEALLLPQSRKEDEDDQQSGLDDDSESERSQSDKKSQDATHVEVSIKYDDDEKVDRMAVQNFLKDFYAATPVKLPPVDTPKDKSDVASPLSVQKTKRRKDANAQSQAEMRYMKLWTLEDRDLSAAAASWTSTANGKSSSTKQIRVASSSPGAEAKQTVAQSEITGVTATSDEQQHSVRMARRAIEKARSESQLPTQRPDGSISKDPGQGGADPRARGAATLLRTSLRYILQN